MNQPIFEGALPILSNILGNNTVAGILAVFNLAVNAATSVVDTVSHTQFKHNAYSQYQQEHHNQQRFSSYREHFNFKHDYDSTSLQSQLLNYLATTFATLNSVFSSVTGADTPLTTYIAVALLSYLVFRIVYGFICWIIRSVINLIKVSIMITALTTLLWFIFNVTSVGEDDGRPYSSYNSARHNDPISKFLSNVQEKLKSEFQRQQQYVQNAHVI
ncbi:hypothetical protein BGZ94_006457 [Podila epigama]|nr:hypothetical protein BGZ94_006457 [Podila epigama]